MVIRKVSVFILVIAFHIVILGVVYLSTRGATDEVQQDTAVPVEDSATTDQDGVAPVNNTTTRRSPVPQPVKPVKTLIHIVAKGDSLGKIAVKYKVSTKAIMNFNNIDDPDKVFLGQKVKIPIK